MTYRMEQIAIEKRNLTVVAQRFLSLDVFRGMVIGLMIIVNTPGKGAALYSSLVHAQWLGFTLADLVFPSFLFAVGNAMSFTIQKPELAGSSAFWKKVIRRTILIFMLGYLLYWVPFFQQSPEGSWMLKPISETRIMGVLQRIAVCYFLVAIIMRYFSRHGAMILATIF